MGSSEITSRLVAQTTDDTGLLPAWVLATRPCTGETWPAPGGGRPHAVASSAHAAMTAVVTHGIGRQPIASPRYRPLFRLGGTHRCLRQRGTLGIVILDAREPGNPVATPPAARLLAPIPGSPTRVPTHPVQGKTGQL